MADSKNEDKSLVPTDSKAFIPLENNPEVMTILVHNLGLSPSLGLHDIFSIDEPELLAFIPRPCHALLLVFPVSETYEKHRREEDEKIWGPEGAYEGKGDGEEVMWYKQTIRNACGLIGLLHAVSNGGGRENVVPESPLATLIKSATPLPPLERADLLYHSQALEQAHSTAASQGQSAAPSPEDNIDLHYVCFVSVKSKVDGKHYLWEMDGRRRGPLNRGLLADGEDALSDGALRLGVRKFLKLEQETNKGEMRFSLVGLAETLD